MKKFRLENIEDLREAYNITTAKYDALLEELNKYAWDDVYNTEDGTKVYSVDNPDIEIEFVDFDNPMARKFSVLYMENGQPKQIYVGQW